MLLIITLKLTLTLEIYERDEESLISFNKKYTKMVCVVLVYISEWEKWV